MDDDSECALKTEPRCAYSHYREHFCEGVSQMARSDFECLSVSLEVSHKAAVRTEGALNHDAHTTHPALKLFGSRLCCSNYDQRSSKKLMGSLYPECSASCLIFVCVSESATLPCLCVSWYVQIPQCMMLFGLQLYNCSYPM